jgi:hypothetical protein
LAKYNEDPNNNNAKFEEVDTEEAMFGQMYLNPGVYDTAVWFTSQDDQYTLDDRQHQLDYEANNLNLVSSNKYTMWVNDTAAKGYERMGDYYHYVKVQSALENAILRVEFGADAGLNIDLEKLPSLDNGQPKPFQIEKNNLGVFNYSYFDDIGCLMLFFGLILSAISVIQLVIGEKRSGALKLLRVMGMREVTYWTSWFAVFVVFFAMVAFVFAVFAKYATSIKPFTHADIFVHFYCAFSFLCCYSTIALFFAAIIKS